MLRLLGAATLHAAAPRLVPRLPWTLASQMTKRARRTSAQGAAASDGSPSAAAADASAGPSAAAAEQAGGSPRKKRATPAKRATPTKQAAADDVVEVVEAAAVEAGVPSPAGAKAAGKKRAPKAPPAPPPPFYSMSMRPPPLPAGPGVLKVLCWNVAGLRALLAKDAGALSAVVQREQPDVLCLQETKLQEEHVKVVEAASQLLAPAGPMAAAVWNCSSEKKGYAGTAVFCRQPPLSVARGIGAPQHDGEGRVVTVELADVYVVNAYVPNSGDGLKRLDYRTKEWDQAFSAYVRGLEAKKPVIIAGDMNCCPEPLDIHDPKGNLRSAGFTQEERDSWAACYTAAGFIDTFRGQYPGVQCFTYYGYRFNCRAKNKGWRLDQILASGSLRDRLYDSYVLQDVYGSDHLPLGLVLRPPPT